MEKSLQESDRDNNTFIPENSGPVPDPFRFYAKLSRGVSPQICRKDNNTLIPENSGPVPDPFRFYVKLSKRVFP